MSKVKKGKTLKIIFKKLSVVEESEIRGGGTEQEGSNGGETPGKSCPNTDCGL